MMGRGRGWLVWNITKMAKQAVFQPVPYNVAVQQRKDVAAHLAYGPGQGRWLYVATRANQCEPPSLSLLQELILETK